MSQETDREHLVGTLHGFFDPSQPFSGKRNPVPTELIVDLATRHLLGGNEQATATLCAVIDEAVGRRLTTRRERISWDEVDVICAQALTLYLRLISQAGLGWAERDAETLSTLTGLFWRMPDRIVDYQEEKTNCVYYQCTYPCMLKSKEIILSWVVRHWDLDNTYEPAQKNVSDAFDFICAVFEQNHRGPDRTTHPDNIKAMLYHADRSYVHKSRLLMPEDENILVKALKQHCEDAKLEELRPWVREDLPKQILKIFQDMLVRSGDRSLILKLLTGKADAA
ncbi:MAG: hypothetical protein RLZZ26_518 [Candidatus Parcubacteria bacterium]|jgi:hypothetical protein